MSTLAPVLSPDDLTWAELQAARLDGDVYELGGAYCQIGELEAPRHRAEAAFAQRSLRLIAELATAAWIWGACPEPTRATFSVTPEARARLAPDRRASVREIVYADGDVTQLGVARVTSPLRTALDLARLPDGETPDPEILVRLSTIGGFDLGDALAALASRPAVPSRRRAEQRLTSILGAATQAVDTR